MGRARCLGAVVGAVLCALLGASAGAAMPVQLPGAAGCVALKGEAAARWDGRSRRRNGRRR
jgi:hypothetical protein